MTPWLPTAAEPAPAQIHQSRVTTAGGSGASVPKGGDHAAYAHATPAADGGCSSATAASRSVRPRWCRSEGQSPARWWISTGESPSSTQGRPGGTPRSVAGFRLRPQRPWACSLEPAEPRTHATEGGCFARDRTPSNSRWRRIPTDPVPVGSRRHPTEEKDTCTLM